MMKKAGHDVIWLDGIAEEWTPEEFERRLAEVKPDLVVVETKTPVVKRHWKWISEHASSSPSAPSTEHQAPSTKYVLVGDHVTALPDETMSACPVDYVLTGGDWDFLLLNLVKSGFDPEKFEPGIWYRADGEVRNTGR